MNKISIYLQQLHGGGNVFDILWCSLRYGASPNNYRDFGFAGLTEVQRSTYVTNRLSRRMIREFNDPQFCDLFEDKTKFAERFSLFFGREWISTSGMTEEDLNRFLNRIGDQFIYKPVGNAQGKGIKVYKSHEDVKKLFAELASTEETAILEGWIDQHPALNAVYPDAVNCLRIITVYKNRRTYLLTGGVTWGNGEKIANASASGIVSPVNMETGALEKPAADFNGNVYERHPITGAKLTDFPLPFWAETKSMLEEAAALVPQVGYVGWDIAVTPTGPVLIEGNATPGYKYYQIPTHLQDKIGNRAIYAQVL